jgi:hypothetical protein
MRGIVHDIDRTFDTLREQDYGKPTLSQCKLHANASPRPNQRPLIILRKQCNSRPNKQKKY